MHRRRYLSLLGAAGLAGSAGCLSVPSLSGGGDAEDDAGGGTATGENTPAPSNVELPIPESELKRGAPKDAIPAITEPEFGEDWSDIEIRAQNDLGGEYTARPRLEDGDRVIGVARDGEARAYPLRILNWHEIVNDRFGGPLLVTFCPLCGSGVTAERRVDGEVTIFGVSGLLWNSDLVMYDRKTESLWSQIMATAIRGPKTGATLNLVPSTMTTWSGWKETHPDTEVLLPPPISNTVSGEVSRPYDRDPYAGYADSERIGIGYNEFDDDRLHPKAIVIGVVAGGVAKAYPLDAIAKERVVNDTVGDLPVVVAVGPDETLVAYERRVDGETLTFRAADAKHMRAGDSRWTITTGRAVDGPHEGTTLAPANDASPMFWFAWADFHPDTELYRG